MCGIAGFVGDNSKAKVSRMLSSISHRGPDDHGIFSNGKVAIGNNRLAVIDLSSKGHQPMFDDSRSLCIVHNGEIYNFLEVRKQLQKDYNFRSKSDTEVVIYAYKKWGVNCVKHLNGMFAFIIYDIKNDLLFGARDRVGEKPLKYFFDGHTFAFASEIKAVLQTFAHKPNIDLQAINDYLTLGYVPAPATGFKNIYKLPPASYFIFKDGKLKIRKYWDLDFSKKLEISEREWEDLLEEKINKVVVDRMISDVPTGSFLSGGVDSSCVTAFMAKNSKRRIDTFSIGFTKNKYDETVYAKIVAKLYNTIHHDHKINSKEFAEVLSKSADYYDEPFADNSLIPSIVLSAFTKKKVTVALSGDGGDENFAGYDRYSVVVFGNYFKRIPKTVRDTLLKPGASFAKNIVPNLLTLRSETFVRTFDKSFYKKYLSYKSFFTNFEKKSLFDGKNKRFINIIPDNKKYYKRGLGNLDNALSIDIASYLPDDLLFKMDIASMAANLEVRAPLLDYELMELTAKMPWDLKIKFFNKKYIFKKMLLDKKILPSEIVNRSKMGFNPPYKEWFKEEMEDYVKESVCVKKFKEVGIFDGKKFDSYINDYFTSPIDYSNNIFALVSLSNWINKYF